MDIEQIKKAIASGVSVEYKAHCLKRMMERNISRKEVMDCLLNGEIIEDYPLFDDNTSAESYPSCLIFSITIRDAKPIHVVVGYNGQSIIIITVYIPSLEYWCDDYKTRR